MSLQPTETHPAIDAITMPEDVWRVDEVRTAERRMICFGRDNTGMYYEKILLGVIDENKVGELLPELYAQDAQEIDEEVAVERRERVDLQWSVRPEIQATLAGLYRAGFFRLDRTEQGLQGSIVDVSFFGGRKNLHTVHIGPDGAVSARFERIPHEDPELEALQTNSLLWERFVLPRGTGQGYHDTKQKGELGITRAMIIEPKEIVSVVRNHLSTVCDEFGKKQIADKD